jgi:hypothetical protein
MMVANLSPAPTAEEFLGHVRVKDRAIGMLLGLRALRHREPAM